MCLHTRRQVVKAGVIADLSRYKTTWHIRYPIGERVPETVELFRCGVRGWLNRVSLFDKRVEVDHLFVVMESLHDRLSADSGRKGGDRGEDGSFRHFEGRG